ncbi:hypothetical protein B296_00016389 [Ensete ventricosum]|uniref:Uncharacterized protein n=1 Tax=Ensete ventricosum TaxID=4639 RepID=A0A426Y169_ENSVE|nr:hypothetical protein B296_00016389 [Ensete ventricosum]
MASEESINAKFEAFKNRIDEKIQSLFADFNMGRLPSPMKSQQGETSNQKDDSQERGCTITDPCNPRMKVDFPRWEGDPIRWISCAEYYFRFYRTANATMRRLLPSTSKEMLFTGDLRRSKGATTIHSYGDDLLHENPRGITEPRRTMVTSRSAMPQPSGPSTTIRAPTPKTLTRDELRE